MLGENIEEKGRPGCVWNRQAGGGETMQAGAPKGAEECCVWN